MNKMFRMNWTHWVFLLFGTAIGIFIAVTVGVIQHEPPVQQEAYKIGPGTFVHLTNNRDSLFYVYEGTIEAIEIFYHEGGWPGGPPDSTRMVLK